MEKKRKINTQGGSSVSVRSSLQKDQNYEEKLEDMQQEKIFLEEKTAQLNTEVRRTNELKDRIQLSERRVSNLREETEMIAKEDVCLLLVITLTSQKRPVSSDSLTQKEGAMLSLLSTLGIIESGILKCRSFLLTERPFDVGTRN